MFFSNMGITASKSPLERRNTVARRSQRRIIHNIKSKVEGVSRDINKFKGTEEDVNFNALMYEIDHLQIELMRKSKDLQPQVRNIYETTLNKVEDCSQALRDKLLENQEKARKKDEAEKEKARRKEEKYKDKSQETPEKSNDITIIEEDNEAEELAENPERRKTVEVKFVQIIPPEENDEPSQNEARTTKAVRSEEKRKSILKVGIPVMPGAMMDEISSKSKKISNHYSHHNNIERTDEDLVTRVNEIASNLQAIECQIADFIGRKDGTQYHRIKDHLNEYLIELNQFNTADEYVMEQVKLCKNYVGTNLSFLEEKAVKDKTTDSSDDVFTADNNNVPLSPVEVERKLQKLSKTTAI